MCAHPGCRAEAELVDARPAPELAPLVRLPLREILDWFMCSDPWPADEKAHEIIESWLQEECKRRGYKDWVAAYHNDNISVEALGNPRRVASALTGEPGESSPVDSVRESSIPDASGEPGAGEATERRVREYLAFSHTDGKCNIYADDGKLQCANLARHGRTIDFRREPLDALLDIIIETRQREYRLLAEGKE